MNFQQIYIDSSRSKHTSPFSTHRSEVERRVVPHLSRPGGVRMRRRLASVGRAWRGASAYPGGGSSPEAGGKPRGRRRPPRSGVLGLGGGSFQSADANQEVSPRRGCRRREEAAVDVRRGAGGAAAATGTGARDRNGLRGGTLSVSTC